MMTGKNVFLCVLLGLLVITIALLKAYELGQAQAQLAAEAPISEQAKLESETWTGYVTAEVNVRYRQYEDDGLGEVWRIIRNDYKKMVDSENYSKEELDRLYYITRAVEKKEGVVNLDLMRKLTNEISQEIIESKFK